MGVIYTVIPLDEKLQNYLLESKTDVPPNVKFGRNPSVKEIKLALENRGIRLLNLNSEIIGKQVDIQVESEKAPFQWTVIKSAEKYIDEDAPIEIYFSKGWIELIFEIVSELSKYCGTLIIIPDTGDKPIVIT